MPTVPTRETNALRRSKSVIRIREAGKLRFLVTFTFVKPPEARDLRLLSCSVGCFLRAFIGLLLVLIKMAKANAKPRSNLSEEELYEIEKQEFETGPLSVLTNAVKNNTQVSVVGAS